MIRRYISPLFSGSNSKGSKNHEKVGRKMRWDFSSIIKLEGLYSPETSEYHRITQR
jgi:hypothetical protein